MLSTTYLGSTSSYTILYIVLERNDPEFTSDTIIKLFSIQNTLPVKLILENISHPLNNLDAISNRISELGDIDLFNVLYENNKTEMKSFHNNNRKTHIKYRDSFNCFGVAVCNQRFDLLKHLLDNTELCPSSYSNEAFKHAIEHKFYNLSNLLINDSRVINSLTKNEILDLNIPEDNIQKLLNIIKINLF